MKYLLRTPARWYIAALVVAGMILRWWDITKASIWHDEGYTMMLAPMSPPEIILRTGRDVHPPLYYLALHYWLLMFGSGELAARSLSAVFMLAVIPLTYLLVRRLWDEPAARIAALLVTAGPFLIRYSQEARMYGMVAFVLLLATYCLVRALEHNSWRWWMAYAIVLAAALYTHYYSIFIIPVHWIYVASRTSRNPRTGLRNPWWWGANVLAAVLFAPWLPVAYAQFTRVQSSFWIPPVAITTLPNTMFQFLAYGSADFLGAGWKVALGLAFIAALIAVFIRWPRRRSSLVLLTAYALIGPLLVYFLSYKRPIYVDRYFVFAAVAFYILLAIFIRLLPQRVATAAMVALLVVFAVGVNNVHASATHQMRVIGEYVNQHYQPGDEILSGELYTFFDFSYYNHTGSQVKLWSTNGVNGYGESSLIYDRADQIIVHQLSDIHPPSGRLWVVGKTGPKDYYLHTPASWRPIGPKITAESSAVQEYQVSQ